MLDNSLIMWYNTIAVNYTHIEPIIRYGWWAIRLYTYFNYNIYFVICQYILYYVFYFRHFPQFQAKLTETPLVYIHKKA